MGSSVFVSGAPHRVAMALSEELAPSRVSPHVFKRAAEPFVDAMVATLGDQVTDAAAVAGVVEARRKQLEGWIVAHAAIFRRAGCEARLEDVDGLVLRCTACFAERVVPAGTMPSLKAMRCPECSAKAG
jgi:hypothetical protein